MRIMIRVGDWMLTNCSAGRFGGLPRLMRWRTVNYGRYTAKVWVKII